MSIEYRNPSQINTQGNRQPEQRGRPAYDDYSKTSDSEEMFQREGQPYNRRYFRPQVEDANKNGRTRARQYNRLETKLLGVCEVDVNHTPFFYVGPEDQAVNGSQRCVMRVNNADGTLLEMTENGIIIECNSGRYELCAVLDALNGAGLIQPI